jgi:hypothetical protein
MSIKKQGILYILQQHCKKYIVFEQVTNGLPEDGVTNTETCRR